MEIEKHKQCFKCRETKPLSAFYKHPRMADGHLNKCKECNKKDVRENLQTNAAHYKEYERKRAVAKIPHRVEYKNDYNKKYQESFPNKRKAQGAVSYAKQDGRIVASEFCEHCGSSNHIRAHHTSYAPDMWLAVTWLCAKCHTRVHADFQYQIGPWAE